MPIKHAKVVDTVTYPNDAADPRVQGDEWNDDHAFPVGSGLDANGRFLTPVGANGGYAFGDGDSYIYEDADDNVKFFLQNAARYHWDIN